MRVLLTLSQMMLGGTETYSVTVAEQLERLGHPTRLHAGRAEEKGRELAASRGLALTVGDPEGIDGLDEVDVALVQDAISACAIAARRPELPQVFVVHGLAAFEHPPPALNPQPTAIVLNDRIGARLAALGARPPVARLAQPIDIERFRPRGPARPRARRVLLASNHLVADRLAVLTGVCEELGLELTRVGVGGTRTASPQEAIAAADIVVGYGRSALEGMAMSRAVYVWERGGGDGWVTSDSYPGLEADGFSGAATDDVIDAARLRADFAAYRPELGACGYDLVRLHHSATKHAVALVGLLEEAVAPDASGPAEPLEALALMARAEARMANTAARLEADARYLGKELDAAHREIAAEHERHMAAVARLEAFQRSRSWRLLAPLRSARALLRGRH